LAVDLHAAFDFRFGAGSRAAHEAEAARRGLALRVVARPGTQVDLDSPADWPALPARVRADLLRELPGLAALDEERR
jgi:2-phospho-L-lactate guanylyltransferase